jgi:serine/threonine protein phosphatase PrpC
MLFETALLSSPGGREDNEDFCGFRMHAEGLAGCWVVADGLGGHRGGAGASRAAVEAVLDSFEQDPAVAAQALAEHIRRANAAVLEAQQADPSLAGMRTTVVTLVASGREALWAHVGDSRLYWLRAGKIREQTRDHSVPQRLAEAGEISPDQIRKHEDRNRLLRSLGAKGDAGATVLAAPARIEPGDVFLLASDGFWEWITEPEMEEDLGAAQDPAAGFPVQPERWLHRMESRLSRRATPGHDNYSAVAVCACAVGAGVHVPASLRPERVV